MRQFMSFFSGALVTLLFTATLAAAPAQAAPVTVATSPQVSTAGSLSQVVSGVKAGKKSTQKVKNKKRAKKKPVWRRALKKARTRAGKPYRYGASGPNAFDCSGLTSWAYKKAGKKLPRTSSAQAGAAKRVKKPRLGDLVFFHNGGSVYHVGLYAGKGKVFHASKPGVPVGKAKIWTSSVFYGRV